MTTNETTASTSEGLNDIDGRIGELLHKMTFAEKVGQLTQINGSHGPIPEWMADDLRNGKVGSVLNEVNVDTANELQRISVEESRLRIPLMIGRDVIHGFKTVFPIPLGQAASWNPELVEKCARIAALEAAAAGINWTFAPMLDIGRDPRWGRVAETFGEDPFLSSAFGAAMVRGFQGDDLSEPGNIAACAKHFAGYGASESGRDYNTTSIPEVVLRNVHLPPFKAALDAGAATFMASFSDLNGVPASGNELLMKQILRKEWRFDGFVVSDWESISQLAVHGLTANDFDSASAAANAGVDMEMASSTYRDHLEALVAVGRVSQQQVDTMVANVLRAKFQLGLFDNPYTDPRRFPSWGNEDHLAAARQLALESVVLLKNENDALPLNPEELNSLAVIGPLSDDGYNQLGTWVFDCDQELSKTPLESIRELVGDSVEIRYARAMERSRSRDGEGFEEAIAIAKESDAILLFLGEESILSGEAHSRADIGLPGNQDEFIGKIANAAEDKPIVMILMAGRPLALESVVKKVDALMFAWHPGSMAGPALADLLFGKESPSGKLPATLPKVTGQIPIYYAMKNTGKPACPDTIIHIDEIGGEQASSGNVSYHLDAGYEPLYCFGHGLSYTSFECANVRVSAPEISMGHSFAISADITNTGDLEAEEVVQLYLRDLVGNVTRPVRELKGFRRIRLRAGESATVTFELRTDDLAFCNREMEMVTEPGQFHAWIGGSSDTNSRTEFEIVENDNNHPHGE